MEETTLTTTEMLEEQIRKTLEELDDMRMFTDESVKPALERLKVLHSQQLEALKLENEIAAKNRALELDRQKLETETAIKIRELELKEADQKKTHEIEEAKAKEQKKTNVTNAVIGGVTAATGVAGILATLHCFKKSMIFEQTGSYTNKTGQAVGGLFNLFRRRG